MTDKQRETIYALWDITEHGYLDWNPPNFDKMTPKQIDLYLYRKFGFTIDEEGNKIYLKKPKIRY